MNNSTITGRYICLLCIVYCLLVSSCGNNSTKTTTEVKSAGQSLFEENCTACHGSDGKLCALGAKDLSISTLEKTTAIEIITNGKNTMTPFGTMLSQSEIDSLASYIQTLKK